MCVYVYVCGGRVHVHLAGDGGDAISLTNLSLMLEQLGLVYDFAEDAAPFARLQNHCVQLVLGGFESLVPEYPRLQTASLGTGLRENGCGLVVEGHGLRVPAARSRSQRKSKPKPRSHQKREREKGVTW